MTLTLILYGATIKVHIPADKRDAYQRLLESAILATGQVLHIEEYCVHSLHINAWRFEE